MTLFPEAIGESADAIIRTPVKFIEVPNSFDDSKILLGRVSDISSSVKNVEEQSDVKVNVKNGDKHISVINYKDELIQIAAEDISSIIFMKTRYSVEVYHGGRAVENIVVALPSHLNDLHRQAMREADVIYAFMLTTVVIARGSDKKSRTIGNEVELNFDPGGGTLQVSLHTIECSNMRDNVIVGDTLLRCKDFDNGMVNQCVQPFTGKNKNTVVLP
ncbi:hypothetical protein POM88_008250 [Heracleum sosnowskyi]|uniref:Uncharacterized protein n=1 Tax=Heracleum sosnowskyi TaxID=360622 RepID=A0AAD8N724_9APIA|nr:hypothetical protein POM88_008250 [Heracleum sosnowskyi]